MGNEAITLIIDAKNLASKELKALQRDLRGVDDAGVKSNAVMNAGGMVAKGVLAAGLAAAAFEATKFVGDSIGAFREEEVGINRLGAALRSNVADWNGNTDAIEKSIRARMNLSGFDDGALRQSLGTLVAATKDVNKALELQSTAMDLARFSGVSLEEASQTLIAIDGGRYKALAKLIGSTKEIKTQTQALAAVQKVAGGQMAAYMENGAGKAELFDAKLGNLQETLGEKLAPAFTSATEGAIELLDGLDRVGAMMDETNPKLVELRENAQKTGLWWQITGQQIPGAAQGITAAAAQAAIAWDTGSERIGSSLKAVVDDLDDMGPKAYTASLRTMAQVEKGIHDGASGVAQAWREAMDQRNQEANASDQIIINNAEIAAQKRILADKHATAAQKAEARIRLRALRADNQALEREMELLRNKGYVYGRGFTLGFVAGLVKDIDRVGANAKAISRVVKKYLQVNSPSELGPFSEQGGPEGWGARFGALWAQGLAGSAGRTGAAAGAFAGSVGRPRTGSLGVSAGVPAAALGAGGLTINLAFHSTLPPSRAQVAELADQIDAEFARRRGRYTAYGR